MLPPLLQPAPQPFCNLQRERDAGRTACIRASGRGADVREHAPVPAAEEPAVDVVRADGPPPHRVQLAVAPGVRGGEGRHVDGVADGLVARRVDHVPEGLLGVLNAAALRVAVAQENQLLLLPRPQPAHTLPVHLQGAETRAECKHELSSLKVVNDK